MRSVLRSKSVGFFEYAQNLKKLIIKVFEGNYSNSPKSFSFSI